MVEVGMSHRSLQMRAVKSASLIMIAILVVVTLVDAYENEAEDSQSKVIFNALLALVILLLGFVATVKESIVAVAGFSVAMSFLMVKTLASKGHRITSSEKFITSVSDLTVITLAFVFIALLRRERGLDLPPPQPDAVTGVGNAQQIYAPSYPPQPEAVSSV